MRFKPESSVYTTKRIHTHHQTTPAKEWNVPHMLGGTVGTVVVSNNNELTLNSDYEIIHTSVNNLIIKFLNQLNHTGVVQCILLNTTEVTPTSHANLVSITTNQISLLSKQNTNECLVKISKNVNNTQKVEYIKAVKSDKVIFNTTFWNVYSFDVTDIKTNQQNFSFEIVGLHFGDDVLLDDVETVSFNNVPQYFLCYNNNNIATNQISLNGLFTVNSLNVFVYSENIKILQLPIRKN